ncbi:protein ZBED8-like [Aphis craccivora]|uniref:Protein ZBED8-like n=1 Tax=Aphis craccivora TaxID=307492 RepID=A0A6G0XZW9_APHCR|nr:protein ZBED8-like [Aphis craccivora]
MLGSQSDFIKLAKDKNPSIIGSHCVIHRQALAAKTLPSEVKNVLEICIKVVNSIKSSALNSRFFKLLCSELSTQHSVLLLTEVRWLSKGNMLDRLYEKHKYI